MSWHVSEHDGEHLKEAMLQVGERTLHVWYYGDRTRAIVDAMTAK